MVVVLSQLLHRPNRAGRGRRASYREGASFAALTFCSVAIVALISSVANSRMYGIAVIGEYALATSVVSVVRFTSTTKERPALVRELALVEPGDPRVTGLFVAVLSFSMALTLLVGLGALVVTELLLSGPISRPSLLVPTAVNLAGYVFIGNTAENVEVILNGFRAGRQIFWARLLGAIAFLVIAVVLAITVGTVWGLIGASVGSMVIGLVHRLCLVRSFMRFSVSGRVIRAGFRTLPGLIRFGLKIIPGAIADETSNESGTWIVASLGTISAVGAYGRAYLLIKSLFVLNNNVNAMLFPTLVERRAKGDHVGYARALVDSLRYTTVALMLPAAAGGGVAQGIMRVFGAGFGRGGDALAVLLLVPVLAALAQNQRAALYSLDHAWLASVSGILRLLATIVLGIILTWSTGAIGAAVALVAGFVVDIAFATQIVSRELGTRISELWPPRERFAIAVACAAGFAASRTAYAALSYPLGVPAGLLVGAAVLVGVLLLGAVNGRDRERYRDARQLIAVRRGRSAPAR